MNILYIAPYLPSKLRIRPFRLIQHLAKSHQVTVISLIQPKWTSRFTDELKPYCKDIYTIDLNRASCFAKSLMSLPSSIPMSVAYFSSDKMASELNRLVYKSRFDLIHTEHIRAAHYTANLHGVPKLFDSVDSLTLAYERGWKNKNGGIRNRLVAYEEWLKMRHYEPKMVHSFDRVTISSPVDKKFLNTSSGSDIELLPNGVDSDYFYWDDQVRDDNSIVFVGAMNYYVNVESVLYFYHSIFPLIQKSKPKIRFSIVGADPPQKICNLRKNKSVEVTGYVEDVRPFISHGAVFVCPMVGGSGTQFKILQALAMGTPVVTTTIAAQALRVSNGEHLLVADDPQAFAQAVLSLLENKEMSTRISVNGRKYIEEYYDWNNIGKRLEDIYLSMLL